MESNFDNEYSRTDYIIFKWFELVGWFEGKLRKLKEFIVSVWYTEDKWGL